MIGQTISHYKILAKLGGGGMGVVYKAEDIKLKRFVALKFLPPDLTRDEEAKQRFVNEAQAASALDHPNICTIHEIDETEDGRMFIAMAYYEGETLKKKVSSGQLSVSSVIDLAIQIAQGLSKAHEKGIIHRDIKLANIFVTSDGLVKILDFGLAKLAGAVRLTKTGSTMGTPAYMSPEQTSGEEVDHRTDIWSLGVLLYEMLTGQLPFRGEYEAAMMYSILNEEPKPMTSLRADVPIELQQIVNKALTKSPDERYQRVDEMLVDLRSLRKELESGISKTRLSPVKHPWKRRVLLYTGITILLILLIPTGLYLWLLIEQKNILPSKHGEMESPLKAIAQDKNRIAVLPLANISADPDNEYFTEGMTEELICTLSKISGLKVIARTSVMKYQKGAKTVAEIGQELKVGTLLEGSVRKAVNQLRITLQLIDARTEEPLWTQVYDRELKDIFVIQSDVAKQVADALKIQLLTGEKQQIETKATENLEAYTLYLRGLYFKNKFTAEGLKKAMAYFQQALEKDPAYAKAYAGLASVYYSLGYWNHLPPKEVFPKANAAVAKALEINDGLAEAHAALASVTVICNWNWQASEREFKRAIELDPNYAWAHLSYALILSALGRHHEAMAEIKQAQELDPLSVIINTNIGLLFYHARQYDLAIEQLQKTLEMDPTYAVAYGILGLAYSAKGSSMKAIAAFLKSKDLIGDEVAELAKVSEFDEKKEAMKKMAELEEQPKQKYVSPFYKAMIYVRLGAKDQALDWLEKAYEDCHPWMIYLKVWPVFDSLRSDPRFTELLKKVGLEK